MNRTYQPFRRRSVLKTIGGAVVGSAGLAGTAAANQSQNARPPVVPPSFFTTWGSDETDDWELTDVSGDRTEPIGNATKPYYVIIPTGLSESPHFFLHDQVVDTPRQNRGAYNANWHAHNVFYDNVGHDHHGKPYNGKEVLTNPHDFYLGFLDPNQPFVPMDLQEVTPNDAQEGRTGGDDYLNTVSQIQHADANGYALDVHDKADVPDAGFDFFVEFTFTCPVRPRKG